MAEIKWILTNNNNGKRRVLQGQMTFIGNEDCEMIIESETVDRQHAVLRYDTAGNCYKIKDLGSKNGTFLNNICLPWKVYITVKDGDSLRFGSDPVEYTLKKKVMKIGSGSTMSKHSSTSSSTSKSGISSSSSSSKSRSSSSSSSKSGSRLKFSNKTASASSLKIKIGAKAEDRKSPKEHNGSRLCPGIEEKNKMPNLTPENAEMKSKHEVEDWFSANAPKKIAKKTPFVSSGPKRPGTPLATLDQIPPTHSPHYSPKAASKKSRSSIHKVEGKSKQSKDGGSGNSSSTSRSTSRGTYTIGEKSGCEESSSLSDEPPSMHLPLDHKKTATQEEIRSIWVSEWVVQHQKTPSDVVIPSGEKPPSYRKCTSENMNQVSNIKHSVKTPSIGSIDEHGTRSRRSLPQIPTPGKQRSSGEEKKSDTGSAKRTQHSVSSVSVHSQVDDTSALFRIRADTSKTSLLSKEKSPSETVPKKVASSSTEKKSDSGKPKSDVKLLVQKSLDKRQLSNKKEDRKRASDKPKSNKSSSSSSTSRSSSSSSSNLSSGSEKQTLNKKKNKGPPKRCRPSNEANVKNSRHSESLCKKSGSGKSSERGRVSRSDSFTMDKPSGVVPIDQIPVIDADDEVPVKTKEKKLTSSSSFTVTKRAASTSSLGTSLLLKDTNAVMSVISSKKSEQRKKRNDKDKSSITSSSTSSSSSSSSIEKSSNVSLSNGKSSRNRRSPRKVMEEKARNKAEITVPRPSIHTTSPVSKKSDKRSMQQEVSDRLARPNQTNSAPPNRAATKLRKSLNSGNSEDDMKEKKTSMDKRERATLSPSPALNNNMSSGLKLNRATLLRKNKAKEMASCKIRPASSLSTGNGDIKIARGKKSTNKTTNVQIVTSKGSAVRSTVYRASLQDSRRTKDSKLWKSVASTSDITDTSTDAAPHCSSPTTSCTNISLGERIVKVAKQSLKDSTTASSVLDEESIHERSKRIADYKKEKNVRRSTSLDQVTYRAQRYERLISSHHGKSNNSSSFSDYMSASDGEDRIFLSPRQAKMLLEREVSTSSTSTFDANNNNIIGRHGRHVEMVKDGEISQEIARVSHVLVKDLEILSKSMDETEVTTTNDISTSPSSKGSSYAIHYRNSDLLPTDSLDSLQTLTESQNVDSYHLGNLATTKPFTGYSQPRYIKSYKPVAMSKGKAHYHSATVLESPSKSRRTWAIGTEPLDNLALSNALSLSNKLNNMAVRIQGKVKSSLKNPCSGNCCCQKCRESTSESKFSSNSSDVPLLQQTATQEMASLINNLRHLECVLKEIEWHVDSGHPSHDPF